VNYRVSGSTPLFVRYLSGACLATRQQALRKLVETRTDNFLADLARSLSNLAFIQKFSANPLFLS
jgi:hypothetical protein